MTVRDNQGKQESYQTTEEHPFWVDGSGWIPASALIQGMKLVDRNNNTLTVVNQKKLDKNDTVYNFTVDDFHTYHVGEFGTWVHNACFDKANFNLNRLPKDIQIVANDTLDAINKGEKPNWILPGRGSKWGSTFENKDSLLPTRTVDNKIITYKEYDIQNVRSGVNAGTDRIVVGSDGRIYYTGTHYATFGRIK